MRRVTRNDEGPMSPEELAKAIEAFKERKAERMAEKQSNTTDEDDKPVEGLSNEDDEELEAVKENVADEDIDLEKKEDEETLTPEQKVQMVKDRRDRRDEEDEPKDEAAMKIIADQDEDIETLLDVIDEMNAEKDMTAKDEDDESKSEANADDDEDEEETKSPMNADSVDRIISQKLKVCRIGDKLNLDGLEGMSLMAAKKAIIKKVEPSIRLDGKSKAYINAAYDIACQKVGKRKDTNYQRSQMFNGIHMDSSAKPQALSARERMIARREGGNE